MCHWYSFLKTDTNARLYSVVNYHWYVEDHVPANICRQSGNYNVFPIRQVQIYKRTDFNHFHQKEPCSSIN